MVWTAEVAPCYTKLLNGTWRLPEVSGDAGFEGTFTATRVPNQLSKSFRFELKLCRPAPRPELQVDSPVVLSRLAQHLRQNGALISEALAFAPQCFAMLRACWEV